MINIRFEEREKIGLQYALETLHGCSPFGQEKIRKLRYYSPDRAGRSWRRSCITWSRPPRRRMP